MYDIGLQLNSWVDGEAVPIGAVGKILRGSPLSTRGRSKRHSWRQRLGCGGGSRRQDAEDVEGQGRKWAEGFPPQPTVGSDECCGV